MQKLHKPGENSVATQLRQGKRKKTTPSPVLTPKQAIDIEFGPRADISMLKAELIKIAESMELSTKGTKTELVERING